MNLKEGTITVNQSRKVLPGGKMDIGATKTHSDRVLALPGFVRDALLDHRGRQKKDRRTRSTRRPGRTTAWCSPTTSDAPSTHPTSRAIERLVQAAKIDPVSPNELRHTAATLLVDTGMRLEEVADLLGHKDTSMLIETYRHRAKRVVDLTRARSGCWGEVPLHRETVGGRRSPCLYVPRCGRPGPTNGSTSGSSATWTASVVTKAKAACEQRGGTTSTCDCAVVYLETHGYLAAGTAQQQSSRTLDATNSCTPTTTSTAVTTTVAAPTTTVSPYTCQVTVGTPAGGGIATPGDMVNFYVESTDRDAAVTGTVTITNNGPGANAVVPLGSATTDGGGRTEYTYTVDSSAVGGADLLSMPPSVGPTALAACPCPERALSRGRQRSRARSHPWVVASH